MAKNEPLPIQIDGTVIVDHYHDYDEPEYYLRATARKKPHYAIERYAVAVEWWMKWEAAQAELEAASGLMADNRIPIKKWKP